MQARPGSPPFPLRSSLLLLALASCARVMNASSGDDAGAPTNVTTAPDAANDPRPRADGPSHPDSLCGNGVLNLPDETCDDGNQTGGDGCSRDCQTETDWICAEPGQPCASTVICGDGVVAGAETCDDRNTDVGDGCSADCQLEPGWICPPAGARVPARVRRRHDAGREQCDDGNTDAG